MPLALAAIAAETTAGALERLARSPDEEAWAFLVRRHGAGMFRTALLITGDRATAEDACQEAFLQIKAAIGRFQSRGDDREAAACAWIMRIAANSALLLVRSRRRRSHHEQQARVHAVALKRSQPSPDAVLNAALRSELDGLPDEHRLPLMLHYFSGLDYDTIAKEVGCSAGGARMRVHRAIERLRSRLTRAGCALTAGAIAARLGAAESAVVPSLQNLSHWQALVHSTATPVASKAAIFGGVTTVTKLSFAAVGLAAVGLCCLTLSPGVSEEAGKDRPKPEKEHRELEAPEVTSGAVRGVVVEKKENRIFVKDREGHVEGYLPHWRGGMPADGGGLDKEMVAILREIHAGDVVELKWEWEERRRVVALKVVEKARIRDGEREKDGEHVDAEKPDVTSGTVRGVVVEKKENRIFVKDREGHVEGYLPHWRGGMPADGGGLDKEMVARLGNFHVGDVVELKWEWEERRRVIAIKMVEKGKGRDGERKEAERRDGENKDGEGDRK
jgi:RNA polymerase sigma-70 factor (ECF subfamily)